MSTNPEYPRTFVPTDADLGDWAQIEPLFDHLEKLPLESPAEMEQLLLNISELAACMSEEGSRRYVEMTCNTEDKDIEARHLHFISEIEPKCRPRWHALDEKMVASPHFNALPDDRYFVLKRSTRAGVEIFREENIALGVEEAKLDQAFQKLNGAMTVQFRGKEHTMQQMIPYLEQNDRALRQEAWEATAQRRLQDQDAFEDLFDQMLKLRVQIAANAGFENYRDYTFAAKQRFDYTPKDCERFHDAVKKAVVPAVRQIQRARQAELAADSLRPWDLAVDPKSRPPLRPFETPEQLADGCHAIFKKVDADLDAGFQRMRELGNLDLESRKGKAPGGYQANLDEIRIPFIFMNAVGMQNDLRVLLHEGGHAFHSLVNRDEPLVQYRFAPMEFCEVASMSMELLGDPYLNVFYDSEEDLARGRREHLEGIVELFPWVATVDAFQQWIYTHPDHTRDQRRETWRALRARFAGIEDWSGYEKINDYLWHKQLHIFLAPFYYIEYGIAQLGALQVWRNAQQDRAKAIADYKASLKLGASKPLPELFKTAGIRFDFSAETLSPLTDTVMTELERL